MKRIILPLVTTLSCFASGEDHGHFYDDDDHLNTGVGMSPADTILNVAQCAHVDLDPESCLLYKFFEILDPMQKHEVASHMRFLEDFDCGPPPLTGEEIDDIVYNSAYECQINGTDVSEEEISHFKLSLSTVFNSHDCWGLLCAGVLPPIDPLPSPIGPPTGDIILPIDVIGDLLPPEMIENVVTEVLQCTNATLNLDSCVLQTSLDLLLNGGDEQEILSNAPKNHAMTPPNLNLPVIIPQEIFALLNCDNITLADALSIAEVEGLINHSVFLCEMSGVSTTQEEANDIIKNVSILLESSSTCLQPLCYEIKDTLEHLTSQNLTNLLPSLEFLGNATDEVTHFIESTVDDVMQCSDAKIDFDTCIVQESLSLLLPSSEEDFMNLITAAAMHSPEQAIMKFICDAFSPDSLMSTEDMKSLVEYGVAQCESSGIYHSEEEIDNVIWNMFKVINASKTCVDPICHDLVWAYSQPNKGGDSITGDIFSDLALGYVAGCSNVNLETENCAIKQSYRFMFAPGSTEATGRRLREFVRVDVEEKEEDQCVAPNLDDEMVEFLVNAASYECVSNGFKVSAEESEEAKQLLLSLFGFSAEKCWKDLCSGGADYSITAEWLDTCADVQLPVLPSEEEMMYNPSFYEPDVKLNCMVGVFMSSEWADFDLHQYGLQEPFEGSKEMCYPPGYQNMEFFCPVVIAPIVLESCENVTLLDNDGDDDVMHPPSMYPSHLMSMSYSYGNFGSFSYNYDGVPSSSPTNEGSHSPSGDDIYINNFCSALIQISSLENRDCLLPLCGYQEPTIAPTSAPTKSPLVTPSMEPSMQTPIEPYVKPSMQPSIEPSISPTNMPSVSPSYAASNSPSVTPTSAPTADATTLYTFVSTILMIGVSVLLM